MRAIVDCEFELANCFVVGSPVDVEIAGLAEYSCKFQVLGQGLPLLRPGFRRGTGLIREPKWPQKIVNSTRFEIAGLAEYCCKFQVLGQALFGYLYVIFSHACFVPDLVPLEG